MDRCDPPWSTQRAVEERCHRRRFGRGGVGWITALFHRNAPVRPVLAREGKITAFLGAGELPSAPPFGAQVGRLSVVSTRLLLQAPLSESSCSSFSFTLEVGQRGARAPRFSGSSAPGILGRATGRQPRLMNFGVTRGLARIWEPSALIRAHGPALSKAQPFHPAADL